MPKLTSAIDTHSEEFAINAASMQAQVDALHRKLDLIHIGGGIETSAKHQARGKLLPRERIDALLDPGSAFMELSALAADGQYHDQAPAAGIITGIGCVQGQEVMIVANDATVKG
ncbi:MAG: methylcrotonoyl-CoA carboxylase, partial [Arenimonas sp.]|nr:methylcrotonoyl-CoA carboxylase [Arenimonas sp.]